MSLSAGTKLGRYEIRSKVGAGGMGEVYLAHDTKLGREVAVKVIPDGFAKDAERLARFEREARLLASLHHPHIAAIHGLEEADAKQFLVLEFVSGVTLADRIAHGPIPLEEAMGIAAQIAQALEAAHDKGIIHRDLKPSNIKITDDDQVKVLDFGLAKALQEEIPDTDLFESPTVIHTGTKAGVIVGTAAYMSPEQAKGKRVDKRTDIWAFGCVLYEMLTGKQPFTGETATDILASILRSEPDWSLLPAATPGQIRQLLKHCLQKDPRNRLRDIGDAHIEIIDARDSEESIPSLAATLKRNDWRRALLFGLGGLLIGVLVATLTLWAIRRPSGASTHSVKRFAITLPETEPLALTKFVPLAIGRVAVAISPDGGSLVYVATRNGTSQLILRRLDQFETKPMAGTEGAYNPFFSPDGKWVAFFAENKLKKVALAGGEPVILSEARNPVGADWGDTDLIFFGDQEGGTLTEVAATGGTRHKISTGGTQVVDVDLLPGGKWLLFSTLRSSNPDYAEIRLLSLETGKIGDPLEAGNGVRYLNRHLLFTRAGTLMAAPFDLENRRITGPAVTVIEGMRSESYGNAQFSISDNGTLAYIPGSPAWIGKPVWVDRQGKTTAIPLPVQCYGSFKLSPDGKRLAIGIAAAKDDIWIYEFERGTLLRLTLEGNNLNPVWSPDGKRVAVSQFREGRSGIFIKSADGSGVEERLTSPPSETGQIPESWSPDGKSLIFGEWNANDQGDIWILPLEGDRKPQPFLRTEFSEFFSSFSPDGHWIVYTSDESGRYEVYVRPYPGPGAKWQISTEGGEEPVWSANGQEVFYRNGEKWMVATVHLNPDFRAEAPRLLFEKYFINVPGLSHYVSADGQRQVMIEPISQESPKQINVVLNWFEELEARVPADKR
jgi:serine/threonine protein kinase/Tol biopolymer transport system component